MLGFSSPQLLKAIFQVFLFWSDSQHLMTKKKNDLNLIFLSDED